MDWIPYLDFVSITKDCWNYGRKAGRNIGPWPARFSTRPPDQRTFLLWRDKSPDANDALVKNDNCDQCPLVVQSHVAVPVLAMATRQLRLCHNGFHHHAFPRFPSWPMLVKQSCRTREPIQSQCCVVPASIKTPSSRDAPVSEAMPVLVLGYAPDLSINRTVLDYMFRRPDCKFWCGKPKKKRGSANFSPCCCTPGLNINELKPLRLSANLCRYLNLVTVAGK